MKLRHPTPKEHGSVEALVQAVVDEVYGGLWSVPPVPLVVTDWSPAWVAVDESGFVGVALTTGEWIKDLWVLTKARGGGYGSALLSHCETEISERGFRYVKLRVVTSNLRAITFYVAKGWKAERE